MWQRLDAHRMCVPLRSAYRRQTSGGGSSGYARKSAWISTAKRTSVPTTTRSARQIWASAAKCCRGPRKDMDDFVEAFARGGSRDQSDRHSHRSEVPGQWIAASLSGLPKGRANLSQVPRSEFPLAPGATAPDSFPAPCPSPRPLQAPEFDRWTF